MLLLFSAAFDSLADKDDSIIIKKLNTPSIRIGNSIKKEGDSFRMGEEIKWSDGNQALYAQNLRTKEYYIFTKEAFESKSVKTLDAYILTCRASTRGVTGKVTYGKNKAQYNGEKRIALVIGNSNYLYDASLKNPIFDVASVSAQLAEFGFDTYSFYDCNANEMKGAIKTFVNRAATYDVALFYYAGHGVSWDHRYYYLPVDVELDRQSQLQNCVEGYGLLNQLQSNARTTLVLLDACRTKKISWARGVDDSIRIQMEAPRNMAVVYSTTDGSFAMDGEGDLSPFAEGFLQAMKTPGISFSDCAVHVNSYIDQKTEHQQNSSQSISLTKMFYFSKPGQKISEPHSREVSGKVDKPTRFVTNSFEEEYEKGMRFYKAADYANAFQYLAPLAEKGYVKAYFPVAEMYHGGWGVTKDRDLALKWYQKAADAGNADAKRIIIRYF